MCKMYIIPVCPKSICRRRRSRTRLQRFASLLHPPSSSLQHNQEFRCEGKRNCRSLTELFIESCAAEVPFRDSDMASSAVLGCVLAALLEDYDIYDELTLATLIVDGDVAADSNLPLPGRALDDRVSARA